jgi:hypothetical protein
MSYIIAYISKVLVGCHWVWTKISRWLFIQNIYNSFVMS